MPAPIGTPSAEPPVPIPEGHVGRVVLPSTGRVVWWTGKVAIGLRHEPAKRIEPMSYSALWVQDLVLEARLGRSDIRPGPARAADAGDCC
jgi:hypothetical protein